MRRYLWIFFALAFLSPGFADSDNNLSVDVEKLDTAFPGFKEIVFAHTDSQPEDLLAQVESIHSQWVSRQEETTDYRECLVNIPEPFGVHIYAEKVLRKLQSSGEIKDQSLVVETLLGSWGLAYDNCRPGAPEQLKEALQQLECFPEPEEKRHLRTCQLIRAYDFAPHTQFAAKHLQQSSMFVAAVADQGRAEGANATNSQLWEMFLKTVAIVIGIPVAVAMRKNKLLWIIALHLVL